MWITPDRVSDDSSEGALRLAMHGHGAGAEVTERLKAQLAAGSKLVRTGAKRGLNVGKVLMLRLRRQHRIQFTYIHMVIVAGDSGPGATGLTPQPVYPCAACGYACRSRRV